MTLHTPEMRDEDGVKLSAGAVYLTLVHLFLFIYFLTSKNVIQRFGTLVPHLPVVCVVPNVPHKFGSTNLKRGLEKVP